jgi:hypothetical protein
MRRHIEDLADRRRRRRHDASMAERPLPAPLPDTMGR